MSKPFRFTTDTTTLAIFDLAALRHRLDDDSPDWWVFPPAVQVEAINTGSAAFIDLGADGVHAGVLTDEDVPDARLSFTLACPSGTIFLGAGEETTADGMEPDCTRGGLMLERAPGACRITVGVLGGRELHVGIVRTDEKPVNAFTQPLRFVADDE